MKAELTQTIVEEKFWRPAGRKGGEPPAAAASAAASRATMPPEAPPQQRVAPKVPQVTRTTEPEVAAEVDAEVAAAQLEVKRLEKEETKLITAFKKLNEDLNKKKKRLDDSKAPGGKKLSKDTGEKLTEMITELEAKVDEARRAYQEATRATEDAKKVLREATERVASKRAPAAPQQ